MATFIKSLKLFSLSTSAVGVLGWPLVYFSESFQADASTSSVVMLAGIAAYSLSTPLIMHMLTKRYVTHLEYEEGSDTYSATVYSLFCRNQQVSNFIFIWVAVTITSRTTANFEFQIFHLQIKFQVSDVVLPEFPTMFTTVLVKGNPLFFDPMSFKEPLHYGRLMAYDQPIDFKLEQGPESEKKLDIEKEEPKRMKQSNWKETVADCK